MPNPPSDGGAQSIHNTTIGFQKLEVDTDVIAINPSQNFIPINTLDEDYIKATNFEGIRVDTSIRLWDMLKNLFQKESYFIQRFRSIEFKDALIKKLFDNKYDIVQLEHLYMFLYLDIIRKYSTAKVIYRPQNVEYIIWERYIENINNPIKKFFLKVATKRLRNYEQQIISECDGIITLTQEDQAVLSEFSGTSRLTNIPMGFNYSNLSSYDFEKQFEEFPSFYHLGSMDWMPNEEAIQWFTDNVLPIIVAKAPDVKIYLAGRNMQDRFFKLNSKNVIVEGEISDPIEYQKDKAIMIVPLLSGSGIRAKIIEGLALGKTIITTTIGAQGIRYSKDVNLIIGDSPEEFADQMLKCYTSIDKCKEVSSNARSLSLSDYHYVSVAKELLQFYSKLLKE